MQSEKGVNKNKKTTYSAGGDSEAPSTDVAVA